MTEHGISRYAVAVHFYFYFHKVDLFYFTESLLYRDIQWTIVPTLQSFSMCHSVRRHRLMARKQIREFGFGSLEYIVEFGVKRGLNAAIGSFIQGHCRFPPTAAAHHIANIEWDNRWAIGLAYKGNSGPSPPAAKNPPWDKWPKV